MYPQRTDTCGALRGKDAGREARLLGWVDSVRDHGGLLFCDLRDRFGVAQAVFNPESAPEAFAIAKTIRPEYVVAVCGQVVARGPGNLNAVLPTGEIIRTGGRLWKDVAGYDLTRLITGSEGTLAVITKVTVALVPMPETGNTGLAYFPDLAAAGRAVAAVIADGIVPATLEFLDAFGSTYLS